MSDGMALCIVFYLIWVGVCISRSTILKVVRWILMFGFIVIPAKEFGVDIGFKIFSFIVIFAPVLINNSFKLFKVLRGV